MFPRIEYLEWIRGRPATADHDLGSSDLRRPGTGDPGTIPDRLAALDPPATAVTVEEQLAAAYEVPAERVLVTAGATHANFLTMATGVDGGRVLVERPGYEPFVATARGLGASVDRVDRPAEADYRLDVDRIAGRCDDGTELVVVTNRHNPTGRHTSRDRLDAVARTVADAGATLLVDEVYAPYRLPGAEGIGFGGGSAVGLPSTVVTGSLTKFFGLGGLRIGWLIGPPDFADRARRVADHVPAVAAPSRALARRALAHSAELGTDARERIEANAARLADFVADRPAIEATVRSGCTFAFLEHDRADGDTLASAAWDEDVLVVPGRFFEASDGVRISVAREPDAVEAGLEAFDRALSNV